MVVLSISKSDVNKIRWEFGKEKIVKGATMRFESALSVSLKACSSWCPLPWPKDSCTRNTFAIEGSIAFAFETPISNFQLQHYRRSSHADTLPFLVLSHGRICPLWQIYCCYNTHSMALLRLRFQTTIGVLAQGRQRNSLMYHCRNHEGSFVCR